MIYNLAATSLGLLHLTFIFFVLFGAFLVLKWPGVKWVHLPAAVWGVLIEWFGWWCPLTKWENFFLQRAGRAGYAGGVVSHYIMPIIYPAGLTRGLEIAIGFLVLAVNLVIYVKVFR